MAPWQKADNHDMHNTYSFHIFWLISNDPPTQWIWPLVAVLTLQLCWYVIGHFNTSRPRLNGRCFADDTFKRIFLKEIVGISIIISLKFVPKGPINNNPSLVQIMAWRRSGDKPLSEPMMVSLLTHICVTRPQWVKECCEMNKMCF